MKNTYKVIFEGKFKSEANRNEVRKKLLYLYKGKQDIVDRFFTSRKLMIKKNIDYQAAMKYKTSLEKAGVLCQIVEEQHAEKHLDKDIHPQEQRTTVHISKEESKQEESEIPYLNFSLREILAESWARIHGFKLMILGAFLLFGMIWSIPVLIGYSFRFFMGEWGRNLYIIYGLQFAMGILGYPFLAGVIMLGIRRAKNKTVNASMTFSFLTIPIFILSVLVSLISFAIFALMLSSGIDHFVASVSQLLVLPLFAISVPLVIEEGLNPFEAINSFFRTFFRNWSKIIACYLMLFCINLFGNFILFIGSLWTIPLFFVANGVLFRHLIDEERKEAVIQRDERGKFIKTVPASPQTRQKPVLEGSTLQNVLALIMIISLLICVGVRLWAIQQMGKIYAPNNVASNGKSVCVHFNKTLFFFDPDGHMHKRLELAALGLNREVADIELLEDGSLLIGDMDAKVILRCDIEKQSCYRIGPADDYSINDNFKFVADEKRNLLFIADTNNHRVVIQDMDGSYIKEIKSASNIDYPNDLTIDENGILWISNTLHERIMPFEIIGDTAMKGGEVIKLGLLDSNMSAMVDAMKHARPLSLAWGHDGNVWVTASDPYVTTADVRVFNSKGKQVKSINLRGKAIPEDIISLRDKLLVADTGRFRVFTITPESYEVSNFGDETFQSELSKIHNRYIMFQSIKKWAGRSLWLLSLGTVLLLFIVLRKKRTIKKQAFNA